MLYNIVCSCFIQTVGKFTFFNARRICFLNVVKKFIGVYTDFNYTTHVVILFELTILARCMPEHIFNTYLIRCLNIRAGNMYEEWAAAIVALPDDAMK